MGASYKLVVKPEHAGHWEGTTFVFDRPVQLHLGRGTILLGQLDTANMVLTGSMTPDEFVTMLLNPPRPRRASVDG